MTQVLNLLRQYRQAPWRVQRQWIGLFLLGLVLALMVAALYLNVTVRTALAGRELQSLQTAIESNLLTNADYEMQLARLTSEEVLRQRARELGFEPAGQDEVLFMPVSDYLPPREVDLSIKEIASTAPPILPEYTSSLFEWFVEKLQASAGRR